MHVDLPAYKRIPCIFDTEYISEQERMLVDHNPHSVRGKLMLLLLMYNVKWYYSNAKQVRILHHFNTTFYQKIGKEYMSQVNCDDIRYYIQENVYAVWPFKLDYSQALVYESTRIDAILCALKSVKEVPAPLHHTMHVTGVKLFGNCVSPKYSLKVEICIKC